MHVYALLSEKALESESDLILNLTHSEWKRKETMTQNGKISTEGKLNTCSNASLHSKPWLKMNKTNKKSRCWTIQNW